MGIVWPERYSTGNSAVHVSNEIEISAPPEIIWAWLVRASLWSEWYPTVRGVTIAGGKSDLDLGSKFTWRIFGVTLSSTVEEFVPHERLAWSAQFEGVDAYHAWLIERKPTGCRVLTEENQKGWLARAEQAAEALERQLLSLRLAGSPEVEGREGIPSQPSGTAARF